LRIPKISIVTPSLNQGRFLQQCLDSVSAQGWSDIEHFVIDGGSTDDTLDILERNKDHLTNYISEPDHGAADAINKGLAMCSGDIVAWLNADDFYLPGAFEKVAEAWRANPGASFWFGNGLRVDEDGKTKSRFNSNPILFDWASLAEGLDYILQPATFMNPKALSAIGLLDTSLRWSFDWDLWLRLAKSAQPEPVEADLAASREWGSTLTMSGGHARWEELRSIGERYSGKKQTVGASVYLVHTILHMVRSNPGDWPPGSTKALMMASIWLRERLRQRLPVDHFGMPTNFPRRAATVEIAGALWRKASALQRGR